MENSRPITAPAGQAGVQTQAGAAGVRLQAAQAVPVQAPAQVPLQAGPAGTQGRTSEVNRQEKPIQAGEASSGDPPELHALVPVSPVASREEEFDVSPVIERLPVELDVAIPVRDFRVRQLLALEPGQVIASQWNHGDDVPLAAGDVQLTWSEFEVIEEQLAVRVTRMP